jgi:type I restriction enzyme S subunit
VNIEYLLSELCHINSGGTPSRGIKSFWGGEIPWAKISDIDGCDGLIANTEETITRDGLSAIRNRIFDAGTLLFAMYGSVGKTALTSRAMATNQAILGINIKRSDVLDMAYLVHWLKGKQHQFGKDARGVAQKNLSAGYVRELKISLPPLEEQRRTAAILDKADAIRKKRQQAIELADQFLRSVFLDMFGDPVTNPKGWDVKPLVSLIDPDRPITYGILKPGPDIEGGIPYVRVVDMANRSVEVDQVKRTTPAIGKQYRRSMLREKDVLLSIRGHVGRLSVTPPEMEGANITQDTARLAVGPDLESWYLLFCLESTAMQRYMARRTKGAAVKGINLGDLKEIPTPVPPRALQQKFCSLVSGYNFWSQRSQRGESLSKSLAGSLTHQAFNLG